jgi:gliding motility-associated-like protein
MKRCLLILIVALSLAQESSGNHITGGEMYYTLTGQSGNSYNYHIVLKLYRDCNCVNCAALDASAVIGIFDKGTGVFLLRRVVPRDRIVTLQLGSPNPCITNPPTVCYQVGYYEFDISLSGSPDGYIVSYQRCCRIAGINNVSGSSSVGATYTAEIPGTTPVANGPANNSARFVGAFFQYSFAAIDNDGDELSYSFCNAYTGGAPGAPVPDPPANPPYIPVPYSGSYTGGSPMGPGVTLNATTGLITGVAPAAGIYVVTVCVTESRNGAVIATQRKDLQIKVGDCDIARALLNPRSTTCDGFTMTFQNDAPPSPLINSYFWDFGVAAVQNDTSNLANPSFTFPDTGIYVVKLVTNRNQPCSDSSTTLVRIYPGFFPGFTFTGGCFQSPYRFTDTTRTLYGVVDSWRWDFGEPSVLNDTSIIRNPQYTYPSPGPRTVRLIVTNSKGCIDTAQVPITVLDKPAITLGFRDTLVCKNDPVTLNASSTGTFSWTPVINITNPNTSNPTVTPQGTTWYVVTVDDNGCLNKDSVQVRVVASVSLQAMNDTTICRGDPIRLRVTSDGMSYAWTPAANLNDPTLPDPIAVTTSFTQYVVVASVGSCSARDTVAVRPVPYPRSDAGPDVAICYNTAVQLNGGLVGSSFRWAPTRYLSDSTILNPVVTPPRTTTYVLQVFDTLGCPKPGLDTITVTVQPKVRAYAGKDTIVVVGQPLQFNATGGTNYIWSPPIGLSSTTISNPIGTYGPTIDTVRYKVVVSDAVGCLDSAWVTVRVYKVNPTIFVPTAFTPNSDGRNDVVRPIGVGIRQINYFALYNRWGERVFYTTTNRQGWDGLLNGRPQATGVYVWMVSAIDYLGKPVFLKGTVTLIR